MGRVRERGGNWHFSLHSHRLWLCHQSYPCASLHATLLMHKNQHRQIFRPKFLLQLPMPAQAQALTSCPPDLAATTSGIPQQNLPENNPRMPLSNHSMDISATSVLITKQCEGSFPTTETNWDSVAVPLLQVSSP